jgi:hypothetical protein
VQKKNNDDSGKLALVEKYDVATDRWYETTKLRFRWDQCAGAASEARHLIYVLGGRGVDTGGLQNVVRMDPRVGSWENLAPLTSIRFNFAAFALDDREQVIAVGGDDYLQFRQARTTVEIYDVRRNAWHQCAEVLEGQGACA